MQQQEYYPTSDTHRQDGTEFRPNDQLDFRAADHPDQPVDSYAVGHERAKADKAAQIQHSLEQRPLARYELIGQHGELIKRLRRDYGLTA